MSSYEADHNLPSFDKEQRQQQHRRPDLSTFFSTLELIDTSSSSERTQNNQNALPIPSNVSAAYRQLANSYQVMLGETEGVYLPEGEERSTASNEWLESMIQQLMQSADNPPERPRGLPNSFFDELDRVPKKMLKSGDACPICAVPFLDDKYPLVVRLPCNRSHMFDLECIQPWLKLNTTCPLDRKDLSKKKEAPRPKSQEDEPEDDGGMYG